MKDVKTFWCPHPNIIIPAFVAALLLVAAILNLTGKIKESQGKKDTFIPLGKLVNVELIDGGFASGATTKITTDKGFYFVYGAVNAKFNSPVKLQKSYGWGRYDCIKIVNTCYNVKGESPETEMKDNPMSQRR